jgi:DNA-binding response OmpR family regulator
MSCAVLIVTTNALALAAYERAFIEAGCATAVASSFEEARHWVDACVPDVLVAALRLGEFNGLHLAVVVRMAKDDATTVVLGDRDTDAEADVVATGSHFLRRPSAAELVGLVFRLRNESRASSRVAQKAGGAPGWR